MKDVLFILTALFAFSACDKSSPPTAHPKTEVSEPTQNPTVEKNTVAIYTAAFKKTEKNCSNDTADAESRRDLAAFVVAIEKCAVNFEILADLVDKVRMEENNQRYEKYLLAIAHYARRHARFFHRVRACHRPNATPQEIHECSVRAEEQAKKE